MTFESHESQTAPHPKTNPRPPTLGLFLVNKGGFEDGPALRDSLVITTDPIK